MYKLYSISGHFIAEGESLSEILKSKTDLQYANLRYADLRNADFYNADLRNADLQYADLQYANLYSANLRNANLRNANLRNANFYNADLRNVDLRYANLYNANLYSANLRNANLRSANLRDSKINWGSHNLIAEILAQAASTIDQQKYAGLVSLRTDMCWREFHELNDPQLSWAYSVLKQYEGHEEYIKEINV